MLCHEITNYATFSPKLWPVVFSQHYLLTPLTLLHNLTMLFSFLGESYLSPHFHSSQYFFHILPISFTTIFFGILLSCIRSTGPSHPVNWFFFPYKVHQFSFTIPLTELSVRFYLPPINHSKQFHLFF